MKIPKRIKISPFAIWYVSILILIAGIVFYFSYQLADVKSFIQKYVPNVQVIEGKKGDVGAEGLPGISGKNGQNGKDSVSTNTVVQKENTIIIHEPIPGKDGEPGAPGQDAREKEFSYNKEGKLQWRYTGDMKWIAVEEAGNE